jgi:hypothetical protein
MSTAFALSLTICLSKLRLFEVRLSLFLVFQDQMITLFNAGVTLFSPARDMNMSRLDVMFATGVGIKVSESRGLLSVVVALPPSYNETFQVSWWSSVATGSFLLFSMRINPDQRINKLFGRRETNARTTTVP